MSEYLIGTRRMLYNRVIGHTHSHTDARSGIYPRRRYGGVRRNQQVFQQQVGVAVPCHPQVARRHVNVDEVDRRT